MKIGIIAEDDSDVAVIKELTLSMLRPKQVGFRRFVGDGCGKLRRKCGAWAKILVKQGCPCIVVVHDLDINEEQQLRNDLSEQIAPAKAKLTVVLIPKREIEAWLLYDGKAIASAFRQKKSPKLPGNPENLADPKKHLRDLVWKTYRRDYLNTVHNAVIAKQVDPAKICPCASFAPHLPFVKALKKIA